jgi:chemotaxis protein CheX
MTTNARPIPAELQEALLQPFVAAAQVTFEQMAGTAIEVRQSYECLDYRLSGDVSAVIGITTPAEGALVLSFREPAAWAVTRRVLAEVGGEPDLDLVRDCVGELANVIAGQARGILADSPYQFAFGTPTIISGIGHEIRHRSGTPCLIVEFDSPLGDVQLQLCIPDSRS